MYSKYEWIYKDVYYVLQVWLYKNVYYVIKVWIHMGALCAPSMAI